MEVKIMQSIIRRVNDKYFGNYKLAELYGSLIGTDDIKEIVVFHDLEDCVPINEMMAFLKQEKDSTSKSHGHASQLISNHKKKVQKK